MIPNTDVARAREVVRTHWGFDELLPMQEQAIDADLQSRDSVVVIPTGGGKSLCFQAPAVTREKGLTVVVSPLIALMKDQLDALVRRGVPAALFNSSLNAAQRAEVVTGLMEDRYRLLYVAPERFTDREFLSLLADAGVRSIAIDEAHCISHWGHDFRPDYRKLGSLRDWFPSASIHAFTATATPRVRDDIAEQLHLRDPVVLVGNPDRPNLTYRMLWRKQLFDRLREIIDRHKNAAGIIYCIRRVDVDRLSTSLTHDGYQAVPYHAGLSAETRKANQDAFSLGQADIVVATVAFGMGIDRSDIRYVIHTAMPKSVEAYHQETGRAGRDGLPAECTLFHTGADFMTWKSIIENSESQNLEVHLTLLNEMSNYCRSTFCRHRLLVEHFGQPYPDSSCGACDVCLGELQRVPDGTTIAMKILSAVHRTGQRFGAKYLTEVLIGADTEAIRTRGHDGLSVHGLLSEHNPQHIRAWIDQLAGEGFLNVGSEYRTFSVSEKGSELLRGDGEANLVSRDEPDRPRRSSRKLQSVARGATIISQNNADPDSENPADFVLYEALRHLRKRLAGDRNLPLYCIVSNKTLTELARQKPSDESGLLQIAGIGPKKVNQYGDQILECIRTQAGS